MLFDFLKSKQNNNKIFVSEEYAKEHLVPEQIGSNYPLVELLRKHGVSEDDERRLQFAFFTNHEIKADGLKNALLERSNYTIDQIVKIKGLWRIQGWSDKIKMNIDSINRWTFDMCKIGFDHDCKFDGWGTFPDPKG